MRMFGIPVILMLVLALSGTVSAQQPGGWLGADVLDVTKADSDKLGWDAPHGAKLGVVASGSPAEKAGLKTGDIIDLADGVEVETSSTFETVMAAKSPGNDLRLRVLSGGRERHVTVTLAARSTVRAAQDAVPILQLDTGGHRAQLRGLAFTPDSRYLVSAGDDRVMRVWDLQSGKTIRTIRGETGLGFDYLTAMALSPDGRWLAEGALVHGEGVIRLYDFSSGEMVALLKGQPGTVRSLAFSPNGRQLISAGPPAILWDVENRRQLHRLDGHTDAIYALGFTPDGARAVTGSYDTTLKLWSTATGRELATLAGHKVSVDRLAISPTDGTIASGSDDGEVRLWDGVTGKYLKTLANYGAFVGGLSFSPDGTRLLFGSGIRGPLSVLDVTTGRATVSYPNHDSMVVVAAISPDGRLAASGGDDIHIWDLNTGATTHRLAGTGAKILAVGFSSDGTTIGWGTTPKREGGVNDYADLSFQFRLPANGGSLGRPEPLNAADAKHFVRARTTHGSYALIPRTGGPENWAIFLDVEKDGQKLTSIDQQWAAAHWSYSFTPDGQSIISGGHFVIAAYDLHGQRLGLFTGHDRVVMSVAPSPDGRLLLSGSDDKTIRLWNLKTRELIASLFHGADGEWVMWTPQGYYTGSPGADKIVGWQINKGADKAADYVTAEQLRNHLNRPDIVAKAIHLASAEQAVRESPGTAFRLSDLLARPVPRFKIVAPHSDARLRGGRASFTIAIETTPDPVKAIGVQVNGRQVEEVTPEIGSGGFPAGVRVLNVPLAMGRNEVRVTLTNAIGEKAESVTLMHDGEGALDRRGTLFVLAIGVDKYPGLGNNCGGMSCNLTFSGADARALVAAIEKRLGPAHSKVVKRLLVNGAGGNDDPTSTNILDAIDLLKQAKETDTVLLFIAGHGYNDGPHYRFLPTNAQWLGRVASGGGGATRGFAPINTQSSVGILRSATVVSWQVLQEAVETAKGRRILFIDTCHSGNAYNEQLGNAAYHANIIAFTSARFDQEALEDAKLGHGLFTFALVEALGGKGKLAPRREISTRELADYVIERVAELAKAQNASQEPQYFRGRDAEDYVLARW